MFVLVTAPGRVLPIPGETFDFGTLERAQALGDFRSLSTRGRRAIRVDLGPDALAGLKRLHELVGEALPLADATANKSGFWVLGAGFWVLSSPTPNT